MGSLKHIYQGPYPHQTTLQTAASALINLLPSATDPVCRRVTNHRHVRMQTQQRRREVRRNRPLQYTGQLLAFMRAVYQQ